MGESKLPLGFLIFLGGIEKQYRAVMGLTQKLVQILNFQNILLSILISKNKCHHHHGHAAVVQFIKPFPKRVT